MTQRHWWNGRWSRVARREVFLAPATGNERWSVELRRGGAGGRSRTKEFGSEADALAWVRYRLLVEGDGWREVADGAKSDAVKGTAEMGTVRREIDAVEREVGRPAPRSVASAMVIG
jgi:hypothetical protein